SAWGSESAFRLDIIPTRTHTLPIIRILTTGTMGRATCAWLIGRSTGITVAGFTTVGIAKSPLRRAGTGLASRSRLSGGTTDVGSQRLSATYLPGEPVGDPLPWC